MKYIFLTLLFAGLISCKSKPGSHETEQQLQDSTHAMKSENVVIKGTVFNKNDSTPVPGVFVIIPGTTTGSLCDDKGNFLLEYPKSEKYWIAFSADGFESLKTEVKAGTHNMIYLDPKHDYDNI